MILVWIFLMTGSAFAWYRPHHYHHAHSHFRMMIGPPVIWIPPLIHYRIYHPPYGYYGPRYDYGYRVWVPGYWEERWTPNGWENVWIPEHWEYRP